MLLNFSDLYEKYKMNVTGVVHVGAHLAEEATEYDSKGITNVWWIEGNPDNIEAIKRVAMSKGHWTICALITDVDRQPTEFHITNKDSMSSSLLEFGTHTKFSPEIKFVDHRVYESRTLDSLLVEHNGFRNANFLNMDIQGAELMALRGAERLLPQIDYIYSEVNKDEVYKGCAKVDEMDGYLADRKFIRVETGWVPGQGWGDALYVRDQNG